MQEEFPLELHLVYSDEMGFMRGWVFGMNGSAAIQDNLSRYFAQFADF